MSQFNVQDSAPRKQDMFWKARLDSEVLVATIEWCQALTEEKLSIVFWHINSRHKVGTD